MNVSLFKFYFLTFKFSLLPQLKFSSIQGIEPEFKGFFNSIMTDTVHDPDVMTYGKHRQCSEWNSSILLMAGIHYKKH